MTRAHLDKRPEDVAAMFDQVAERYDLLNDVLSLGQDRLWRRFVAATVDATAGAYCIACDFSFGMLRVGSRKPANGPQPGGPAPGPVRFVAGDALRLPF